jgi:hypothetical protein
VSDESTTQVSSENPVCSFCNKTKEQAGCPVFCFDTGKNVCFGCVKKADDGGFPVAFCAACTVKDGKHASSCPEEKGCA